MEKTIGHLSFFDSKRFQSYPHWPKHIELGLRYLKLNMSSFFIHDNLAKQFFTENVHKVVETCKIFMFLLFEQFFCGTEFENGFEKSKHFTTY